MSDKDPSETNAEWLAKIPNPIDRMGGKRGTRPPGSPQPYKKESPIPEPRRLWAEKCPVFLRRWELGMTQHELAETCGFHQTMVSQSENNRRTFTRDTAERLGAALQVDPQDLFVRMARWAAMEPQVAEREQELLHLRRMKFCSPITRRAMREEITFQMLIERAQVSSATVTKYAGDPGHGVKLLILKRIADVLGCDFGELCCDMVEWNARFEGRSRDDAKVEAVLYEEDMIKAGKW